MDAAAVELARRVDGSTITGACTAGYTQMHVPARPARPAQLSARPAPPQPAPAKQPDDRPQPEGSALPAPARPNERSEEHTSELQSLMRISYAVFCLTKKKKQTQTQHNNK